MSSTVVAAVLFGIAFVAIVLTSVADALKAKRLVRQRIEESWGKAPSATYKPGELDSIASYFLNRKKEQPSAFTIDDVTWHDLDMDEVFVRLNNTGSTPGEETLYCLLRTPCFDPAELASRNGLVEFFQRNSSERTGIQIILARLGKIRLINVTDLFFQTGTRQPWRIGVYRFLAVTALLSPLSLLANTGLGVLLILLSFVINMIVYYRSRSEIGSDLSTLSYVVRIVRCVREITKARVEGLGDLNDRLASGYEKLKIIEKKSFFLFFASAGSLADLLAEYIRIILLKELIDREYLLKAISEHRKELIEVYDIIGLIDSLISTASYRESVSFHTEPELQAHSEGAPRRLAFRDIYHPLIENPVLNSLSTDQSVLVTGSNASGKSTFLKTVAINAILAQSIFTCLAREYSSCFYAVFSSMALKDSVRNGESYFIAEVKSIKRILDHLGDRAPCLCFIDEVLRGTNTVERIAASSQVLLYLARHNSVCFAATHDIELTYILERHFRNVHFQESIVGDSIVFDYKLHEGRAGSRNAIRLLSMMGYDGGIVREAETQASHFTGQGRWEKAES